jgi:outer membrane protein
MSQSLRQQLLTASLGLWLVAALAPPVAAETLADALAEAYQTNPNLQAQRANQRALDENYVQARTGWRPTLNLQAQAIWTETRNPADLVNPFAGVLPIERQKFGIFQLNFSQPIWTGGRTAAAVTAANADVLQGREQLRQIEAQVMQAVITSYADVLRDQQNVIVQRDNQKLLQSQLDENQARFDVGEVTRTDVAQSQSRLAAAQAQLQVALAQLAIDRATYATLVGHNPGDLAPTPSLAHLLPGNVDDAFGIAEQNSPQLRAQEYAEQASRARVAQARAGRMPTLSFNATAENANGPIFPYVGNQYQKVGQAFFTVTVPLFSGGLTTSQIRQAIERNNADRITIETQRRAVLQTITQAWNQLITARANISATDEQVRAATIAYEGMHEEEQSGLRSTLDVLIAAQDLNQARLSQAAARHDEYVAAATVLGVIGRLDSRDLIPSQPQYDPAANFRRLRITWGWVPWEEPIGVLDHYLTAPPMPKLHTLAREPAVGPGLQPPPGAPQPAAPQAAPAPSAPPPAPPPANQPVAAPAPAPHG